MPVQLDVFPARVIASPHGALVSTRIVIRDGVFTIWRQKGDGAEKIATGPTSSWSTKGSIYTVTMDDGSTWQFAKSGGCGCGSPLRRVNINE